MTEPDQDIVLLRLERGDRGEIRLTRSRYEGRVFTKFQLWYPAEDGSLKPGRQVITIRDHELHDVLAALGKVAAKVGKDPAPRPQQERRPAQRSAKPPSGAQPGAKPYAPDQNVEEIF